MKTQVNDFIRLCFEGGDFKDLLIHKSGMHWPPPQKLSFGGMIYQRTRVSDLSDEVAANPKVARGAEYHLAPKACQVVQKAANDEIPVLVILPSGKRS